MSIKETLRSDMKTAMKARNKVKLSAIRMMLSEIQVVETAGKNFGERDLVKSVDNYRKRLAKSLDGFKGEKRESLKEEISIVEHYLPKKATEEEICASVEATLSSTKEFSEIMKTVMGKFSGNADGSMVSRIIKEKL